MIKFSTYTPAESLTEYIQSYGIIDEPEDYQLEYISPPIGMSGFILQLGNPSPLQKVLINGVKYLEHSYSVTGQITVPVVGKIAGRVKSVLVFFNPLGMHQLFRNNMELLTNKSMSLHSFLGEDKATDLISKLRACATQLQLTAQLDSFFMEQRGKPRNFDKLKEALTFIHQHNGNIAISQIEKECFIHRKSLERHFLVCIGISPKTYSQIYRFKSLVSHVSQNPKITWQELCNYHGYYDQSHLNRYFKEYLNISPNELVKLDLDFINYLLKKS